MVPLRCYLTTGADADLTQLRRVDKTLKRSRNKTVDLLGRLVQTRLMNDSMFAAVKAGGFSARGTQHSKNCSNKCK